MSDPGGFDFIRDIPHRNIPYSLKIAELGGDGTREAVSIDGLIDDLFKEIEAMEHNKEGKKE